MTLSNEELKHSLAKLLWENNFGDEPFRNWHMAEMMLIEDGFLGWRRQALRLREYETQGQTHSEEYQQACNDFLTGVASWVYATSLGMSWPSLDPDINWRIAGALKSWLCMVDFESAPGTAPADQPTDMI